ncbi:hypothetical protein [Streptomyces clavuligerus]|uniref:Uncharacterized protein n=1 Tax=Streptomyces clavuligerus TaxID=1901 RepID=D5SJT0_STRCL|nr:hypothetical protein [Streptomyces clavuligerus]EFG04173.1 Hypothetical protein SCLAV_p0686 [Streptomyces clavuligerus]MBY6307346.1 hypothetical protein [Streptomyces clavuligerus]QCS10088.1 hypothetical protein CRV15_31420 [Streptomyces clavuligerus]QPJ97867.1 hypothetical protein GE265_33030 [Streptomyces clavuligerus]WDN56795.1 hypothetical protein LL058_33860 [Streptomyces clavuligerus]
MIPEKDPAADLSGWDAALAGAFDVLLDGVPALDPAAGHDVYYASDPLDEFLFPNPWATPDALSDPAPRHLPDLDGEYPFSPWTWRFDLSESLFRFDAGLLAGTEPWGDGGHKGPRPFDDTFVTALRTVSSADEAGDALVRGAELGPLLGRHGVDLTDGTSTRLNNWLTVLLRVATDGTLTDAMRAATFTERGPGHLVSIHDMSRARAAAEPWEERLSTVAHPALRDHLRMLCLTEDDARAEGGFYCGADHWPWTDALEAVGCSLVAGWGFGESQAGAAVVRLPDRPGAR